MNNMYQCLISLEKKLEGLTGIFFKVACVVALFMPIPITLEILLRMTVGISIFGVIEMEEISMLFIVFFGLAYLQGKNEHIRIDLITSFLSKDSLETLELFTTLVSLGFFLFISFCSFFTISSKMGELSLVFGLPMPLLIAITTVGLLLVVLTLLLQSCRIFAFLCRERIYLRALLAVAAAALFILAPIWVKSADLIPSRFALGGAGMLVMLMLLLLRMPLGFAMGSVGTIGLLIALPSYKAAFAMLGATPYSSTASFTLAVVPLFILMGALCFRSGISNDLFNAAYAWCGRLPGGLGVSSVIGCAGFAAVCGDSMATAVTMGTVALPEMRKKNYDPGLACGTLAAGGTLGILIPPSIGFIFYAIITEESVGKLFAAGVIPGIVLASLFSLYVIARAVCNPGLAPAGERSSFRQKLASLRSVVFMLLLFMLILGGIFLGWFSPTEGGAAGAAGAFVIALCRRRLSLQGFWDSLAETATFSSKLMVILFGVGILGNFMALTRMPYTLADILIGLNMPPYVFLAALVLLFLVLGCVMNVIPMLLLTLPSLYPTVVQMGFDPIWFGVVTVLVMEMGQITPPVGLNVFAIGSVSRDVPLSAIFAGVLPFVLIMLLMVMLLVLFPGLALWLPGKMI